MLKCKKLVSALDFMTEDAPFRNQDCVLAVDPGRKKCGLAVVSHPNHILERKIVPCAEFSAVCRDLFVRFQPKIVLLGSSTGSKAIADLIRLSLKVEPKIVDERHTTELAKTRYFLEFPPKGLWKFVPLGLQSPPGCYDDFAAVVMAERYLNQIAEQGV